MNYCIFTNDDNCEVQLLEHIFSSSLQTRDNHEVIFRRINTFLIKNKIIKNNIIDSGAWVGDNTIPWSKNIEGLVYAIDPSQENCNFINETCKLNGISNVKTITTALSNVNEVLTTNNDIQHCSFVYENTGLNGANKTNAVSLDYLNSIGEINNIGYIHLDVEGMEYRVLMGGINVIESYRPIISFEQHLEIDDYNAIVNFFSSRDYSVFLINEILPGCRHDCRNSFAFPNEYITEFLINDINKFIGFDVLIKK